MKKNNSRIHSTPKVGLLMEASRGYERGLLKGIADFARLNGPWQFYRSLPDVVGGTHVTPQEVKGWNLDGLILREAKRSDELLKLKIPTIFIPSTAPIEKRPNVFADENSVGAMAAKHLLDCGLRNFAYCGMDIRYFWSRRRRDGFAKTIKEAGFETHVFKRAGGSAIHWEKDLPAIADWLRTLPTPLGIMVCTDDFSVMVTEACKAAGLNIPEDVAMIGVGNDEAVCDLASVSLTSIKMNTERAGYECANTLNKLMKSGRLKSDNITVNPIDVIPRHSTDILALEDQKIALALKFIREHASQPINVNDVVNAVPLSRRALYNRFKKATGTSVYSYVKTVRLEMFTRLLLETNLSVAGIAESMGFQDEKNVARFFRDTKGMTPREYRIKHKIVTKE